MGLETEVNKESNWKKGFWGGMHVEYINTTTHWLYKQNDQIFAQQKEGNSEERIPYCTFCNTKARIIMSTFPIHEDDSITGSGNVGVKYNFYCEHCNEKPSSNQEVLDILL